MLGVDEEVKPKVVAPPLLGLLRRPRLQGLHHPQKWVRPGMRHKGSGLPTVAWKTGHIGLLPGFSAGHHVLVAHLCSGEALEGITAATEGQKLCYASKGDAQIAKYV